MRLWLAVLGGYLALGATIQALPSLVDRGPATIGLLVTLAAAATAVARPFAGRLADRGQAAAVARAGAALVLAGALGHLAASGASELALARLTIGAGEGALFTGALARVLEDAAPARRGRLIGHFGLSMWGGLATGPPLAAVVAAELGARGALWLAAAAAGAAVALTAAAARNRPAAPPASSDGHAPTTPAPPRPRLLPPAARRPGAILGLASFGYGTVNAFAVLQAGPAALAVFAAAFLAVRLLGSRLVDDLGPRTVILASALLEAVALAGVAIGVAPLGALALAGASLALVFPALAVWVIERAPERERGAAVGAMTSCWDLGIAAAGPAGALVVAPGQLAPAFAVAAALAGVAAFATAAAPAPARVAARAT
jgi:MFS family permease